MIKEEDFPKQFTLETVATVICQHHKLGPEETVTIICNLDEFQTKLSDQDKKDKKRQIFVQKMAEVVMSVCTSLTNLKEGIHLIPIFSGTLFMAYLGIFRHTLSVGIYYNIRIESGDCECLSQGRGVEKCATKPGRKYGRHTLCEYGISSSSLTTKELKILMQLSHWQRSQQLSTDLWQTHQLSGRDGSGVSETIPNKSKRLSNSNTSVFTVAFNCVRIRLMKMGKFHSKSDQLVETRIDVQ